MANEAFDWLGEHRFLGPLALVLTLIITQAVMIPDGGAFCLGTGFALMKAYKNMGLAITVGSLTINIGMWIGSIIGMLVARYMFREYA